MKTIYGMVTAGLLALLFCCIPPAARSDSSGGPYYPGGGSGGNTNALTPAQQNAVTNVFGLQAAPGITITPTGTNDTSGIRTVTNLITLTFTNAGYTVLTGTNASYTFRTNEGPDYLIFTNAPNPNHFWLTLTGNKGHLVVYYETGTNTILHITPPTGAPIQYLGGTSNTVATNYAVQWFDMAGTNWPTARCKTSLIQP